MVAISLILTSLAYGQAVVGTGKQVAGWKVFNDYKSQSKRYVSPGRLKMGLDSAGSTDLNFVQMVYVGTAAAGDQGTFRSRSILSFRVEMQRPTPTDLEAIRQKIYADEGKWVTLQVLSLRGVDAKFNFVAAPDRPDSLPQPPTTLEGQGALEQDNSATPAASLWVSRTYTLVPDDASSQLLWEALKTKAIIMSVSYSVQGDAVTEMDKVEAKTNSDIPVGELVKKPDPKPKVMDVASDTIPIMIDPVKDAAKLKRVDINQSVPANYAAMRIFCVDFNNQLRPDLALKIVEIRAVGVNGRNLDTSVTFNSKDADVTSASLKFKFAVNLKKPYQYRIREVALDGSTKVSGWIQGKEWGQILDVTTPPDQRPAKPAEDDGIGGNRL